MLPALWMSTLPTCFCVAHGAVDRERWAVAEFLRPSGGKSDYGQIAAKAVVAAMTEPNAYDVISFDLVCRAASASGFTTPPSNIPDLVHVGEKLRARAILRGEVLECGVEALNGGKRAWAALRAIAYDVPSARPCSGALESAESSTRPRGTADATLVAEAIRLAASRLVRRMQLTSTPRATVLNYEEPVPLINEGTHGGFRTGDKVVVMRGSATLGDAVIGRTERDQAEIVPKGIAGRIFPGDRVWTVFDLPLALPHVRRVSSRVLDVGRSLRRRKTGAS